MDFEKFTRKFQEVAETTAKKAGDQVQIAKLGIDKASIQKELNDAFTALGKYCYLNIGNIDGAMNGIKEYKRDIDDLKLKIGEIEREIESVKKQGSDKEDSIEVLYTEKTEDEVITFKPETPEDEE